MFKKRKNSAVNSKPNVVEDISPLRTEKNAKAKRMESMDDATLEFQYKRIYDRFLLELDNAKSLKAGEIFRLSVIGVITTIEISVLLGLLLQDVIISDIIFTTLLSVIIVIFVMNVLDLFADIFLRYKYSHNLSENVISIDRSLFTDELKGGKKEGQINDILNYQIKIDQLVDLSKVISKSFGNPDSAIFLFIISSLMSLIYVIQAFSRLNSSGYSLDPNGFDPLSFVLEYHLLLISLVFVSLPLLWKIYLKIKSSIQKIIRFYKYKPFLTGTCTSSLLQNESLKITGTAKTKQQTAALWICTKDALVNHSKIRIKENGEYEYEILPELLQGYNSGTNFYCIIQISSTSKKENVQLFTFGGNTRFIAKTLKNGDPDLSSIISLDEGKRYPSIVESIAKLMLETKNDIYIKIPFSLK